MIQEEHGSEFMLRSLKSLVLPLIYFVYFNAASYICTSWMKLKIWNIFEVYLFYFFLTPSEVVCLHGIGAWLMHLRLSVKLRYLANLPGWWVSSFDHRGVLWNLYVTCSFCHMVSWLMYLRCQNLCLLCVCVLVCSSFVHINIFINNMSFAPCTDQAEVEYFCWENKPWATTSQKARSSRWM